MTRLGTLFFLICLFAGNAWAAGDDVPAWLRRAASVQTPTYDKTVPAVVLADESTVTVGEDGRITTVWTFAVRILSREGRNEAAAAIGYETDSGKVKEFKAWMIRPSGQVKSYGNDQIIDQSDLNDVYNESRMKKIVASADSEPGAIFGYQSTTETKPYFYQSSWYFQDTLPVVSSRLTLALPAGWSAKSLTFNHPEIPATVNGTSYTWELRDLAPVEIEPASPNLTNLVPRLVVKYFPTEGVKNPGVRAFETWSDVSRWYSELSDPSAMPDDKIAAKARELTTGAKTELEKIRAIGRFVQNIQYISVQIGVGRWRPHSASEVLAKSYGDCKDKATLMRAMLKSLDIQSYPVLIFSGDPTFVRDAWVSPGQFNHCIIAVKVGDETQALTVIHHPALGRLLIFDATDDNTPVGDLPEHEQGSFALIAAGSSGSLVKMPKLSSVENRIERNIEATLSSDGAMVATLSERAIGQSAVAYRREFRGLSRSEYVTRIEGWVTSGATAAKVSKVEPKDRGSEGRFDLDIDFSAASYGQLMRDRLLIFKPALVSRRESLFLTSSVRHHPVVLESRTFAETVRVKLPAGFEVDELPDPLKIEAPFGSYRTTYEVKDGELIFARALALEAATLPASQYQSIRSFFERIRAAEQAPVVLARK